MKLFMRSLALVGVVLGATVTAQPIASTTYFMPANERGPSGGCQTNTYRLDASFGSGVVPTEASSATYKFLGGFCATIPAQTTGRVWLTGARPAHAPILGGVNVTVHGHELDLVTGVTIGGVAGTIASRSKDKMVVTLPTQPAPGPQPVVATTANGPTTMPGGLGILPMAEKNPPAIESSQPFQISYRGSPGDTVYIAVASGLLQRPFRVAPYHYGLLLNPALHVDTIGPLPVANPTGVLTLKFPGINFPRPLYVQMLGIPVNNPGYNPGSLTNVIAL